MKKKISKIPDQEYLKKSLVKFIKNWTVLNERRIHILKKLAGRIFVLSPLILDRYSVFK